MIAELIATFAESIDYLIIFSSLPLLFWGGQWLYRNHSRYKEWHSVKGHCRKSKGLPFWLSDETGSALITATERSRLELHDEPAQLVSGADQSSRGRRERGWSCGGC